MSDPEKLRAFLSEKRNLIVGGVRPDGRPHLTPNWFLYDEGRFYVSTMRSRAKYAIFSADPRAELLVDDSTGFRAVMISGTAAVREDLSAGLPYFRAIREKYGREVPADDGELLANLQEEDRFLLEITPTNLPSQWPSWGLD
jgi:PPOX class probable F420-dependent enzyme